MFRGKKFKSIQYIGLRRMAVNIPLLFQLNSNKEYEMVYFPC